MDTLKTAVVVVLLLAVLYGVYVALNQPDQEVPEEIAWAQQQATEPLQVDFGATAGSTSSGITATVSDSSPWNPDQASGGMQGHDHGMHDHSMAAATDAAATIAAQPGYGHASPAAQTTAGVEAPELISSAGSEPSRSGDVAGRVDGGPAYPSPPPGYAAPQTEPAGGYDARNAFPSDQASAATAVTAPPLNAKGSVYAPAQPNSAAPSNSYGEPAGLGGNPAVTADAAPPVAGSYSDSAPEPEAEVSRVDSVLDSAQLQIEQGQYYEALLTLSFAYHAPELSPEESQKLQAWLDPLAAKVIYSNEHLIGAAYQLQAGETLQSVAAKHKVPWQLLANINGLRDPAAVQPGMSIKVVPGPFHAEVDVVDRSLTLFAGRLYAGRFAITVNPDNVPAPGEYQVNDKQPGHSFYAGNAQTLAPRDPQNPYGGVWIDLGGNVSIHGTSSSPGQSERLGCISLASRDANDLYGILSLGSSVVIRR